MLSSNCDGTSVKSNCPGDKNFQCCIPPVTPKTTSKKTITTIVTNITSSESVTPSEDTIPSDQAVPSSEGSTPFEETKLKMLDTVTNTLYTTGNNNDIQIANNILNQFQQLPNAYSYCDFILSKSQLNFTKIFALGILETFIKQKWNV